MRQKLGLSWVKRQRRWPGRLIGYLGSGDPRVLPVLVVEIIAIMVVVVGYSNVTAALL